MKSEMEILSISGSMCKKLNSLNYPLENTSMFYVILACPESFFTIPNWSERFPTSGNDTQRSCNNIYFKYIV